MTKGCCGVVKKGWSFKKLCKGDGSLEDEDVVAGHPKLTVTN